MLSAGASLGRSPSKQANVGWGVTVNVQEKNLQVGRVAGPGQGSR